MLLARFAERFCGRTGSLGIILIVVIGRLAGRYILLFDFFRAVRLLSVRLQGKTLAKRGFRPIQKYFFGAGNKNACLVRRG
ncbi:MULTISPECIES: hypothetical protein [unclassified Ensifer]|uniref:hypothetical protein n=1 Tax=unclassified Ensifer TaxID=2633371 RepID=UPI000812C2BE|nr:MULTISPECIES: hypothetical protein [unclassified Ensifer]